MKKYKIFLFDADGTLYDFDKAESNALSTMFAFCGFDYSESILKKYREINEPLWGSLDKGEVSKEDLQTLRFTRLFAEIGVHHDVKEFNRLYLFELGKGAFMKDGAFEICKKIANSGKLIYIVTNGILATQESRIQHSQIKNYVSGFFVSEFVGYQKPDKKYFEYVFSHIPQVGKENILLVGDSLTLDILGGINAKIDACWYNEKNTKNNTGITPTYEIGKLCELDAFI